MLGYGSKNPFCDDEPGGFGNNSSGISTTVGSALPSRYAKDQTIDVDNFDTQTQLQDSRHRAQASQYRALASIANSEQIAISTAEELNEQGEKLDKAERRLDDISALQKDSQRHLNTISSVFGGLKNIFYRRSSQPSSSQYQTSQARNSLQPSGLHDNHNSRRADTSHLNKMPASKGPVEVDEFDRNLSVMSDGMLRLKSLAQGMNDEINAQNAQLDRMAVATDRVSDTIGQQNKQMNKLLGLKPK